jgi:ubiquinone/menaquinone biosynthesis C-methylase UbiE
MSELSAFQDDPVLSLLPSDSERSRYHLVLNGLLERISLFCGQRVLDFGASWGTSAIALIRAGASEVEGVEPDVGRVAQGRELLHKVGLIGQVDLRYCADTSRLPYADGTFPFILSNGVIEHILLAARPAILREIWRVLAPSGHFMVAETPNPYYPKDYHTTQLWLNHWLPERLAHRRAVRTARFLAERTDWASSGWRGAGYYGLVKHLRGARLIPEPPTRLRHRLLATLGLPAHLIDPWPLWVFRKPDAERVAAGT